MRHLVIAFVLCGCGSATGPIIPDAFQHEITSINITPPQVAMRRGLDGTLQLAAKSSDNDNNVNDVTNRVTWTSMDPTIATVDAHGLLTPIGAGTTMVTAQLGTVTGMVSVQIISPTMVVAQATPTSSVTFFDAFASGDAAPTRTISGATTTLSFPWGLAINNQELFVTDENTNAIDVFPLNGSGNVAPTRRIMGATTGLLESFAIGIANGEIYVGAENKILVFPVDATGDVAPSRTITGAATTLGTLISSVQIYKNEIYVVSNNSAILVFPMNGMGNVAPSRTITGAATHLSGAYQLYLYNDEIYVGGTQATIPVFASNASGNIAPLREISTSPSQISAAIGLQIVGEELYEVNALAPAELSVFGKTASGNTTPTRQIVGPTTTLANPRTIIVF